MIRPLAKFIGIHAGMDVSKEQAKEILLGIESRVDVKQYADPSSELEDDASADGAAWKQV